MWQVEVVDVGRQTGTEVLPWNVKENWDGDFGVREKWMRLAREISKLSESCDECGGDEENRDDERGSRARLL